MKCSLITQIHVNLGPALPLGDLGGRLRLPREEGHPNN
jgi:hypothetical protein